MPAIDEKRRRKKEIEDILVDHRHVGSQTELVELLAERGIKATQSSISRDLQEMGVKRVKGRYVMKPWRRVGSGDLTGVAGFVMNTIKVGANLIVLQCRASSARMVADAIESEGWPEVAGVIAGDDTIFIATLNEDTQRNLVMMIQDALVV
jgi:transcriptional regulator of arginine metabolism